MIDLVFREEAVWQIVDYKTDAHGDPGELQKYLSQLRAYEDGWTRISH